MNYIIAIIFVTVLLFPSTGSDEKVVTTTYKTKPACQDDDIECYIVMSANKSTVDKQTAKEIAFCESGYDPHAKNPSSTASGVYQFTQSTWQNYCSGDVFNYKENTDCFIKLFPQYPNWWECNYSRT